MSPSVYTFIANDGTRINYVKKAGSGTPLFFATHVITAMGYTSIPGTFYGKHKHLLDTAKIAGRKTRVFLYDGVVTLLNLRHPPWESEFYDTFALKHSGPITQDNSDTQIITEHFEQVLEEIRTLRQDTKNMGKALVDNQKKLEAVLQDHAKKLNTTITVDTRTCTSVPVYGTKRHIQVPITGTHFTPVAKTTKQYRGGNNDQSNLPLFTHVEGYRTYKEMMAYNGYVHIVGTPLGRTIAQQLARVCKRHNIQLYMVLDAERLAVGSVNKRRDLTDGAVWTYPIEMWDVVKPYVEEQIKKHQ